MVIEQTVDIPADGWFHLDLPPELAAGARGRVVLTFTPAGDVAAVRDITPEETRLLAKRVIEEHRPAFTELAK